MLSKILIFNFRDVINSHQKPKNFSRNFSAPLLIMNDFNKKEADNSEFGPNSLNYSLTSLMYQSLFAPLNVAKVNKKKKNIYIKSVFQPQPNYKIF